jgi:hypothetical protein
MTSSPLAPPEPGTAVTVLGTGRDDVSAVRLALGIRRGQERELWTRP